MIRWILCVLVALSVTVCSAESPESTLQGIVENMQANMSACTEENLPALLDCMSKEMPNKDLFVQTVKEEWAISDAYHKLVDVKLLWRSDAPNSRTDYPYATAVVTQQIQGMAQAEADQYAPDGRMAHVMNVAPRDGVTRCQMLFKHEGGRWKLVAGLTQPVPVDLETESECKRRGDCMLIETYGWEPGKPWPSQKIREQVSQVRVSGQPAFR